MKTGSRMFYKPLFLILSLLLCTAAGAGPYEEQADQIFKVAGVKGGLVVHIGCGDGKLTAALRAGEAYLVHGLDSEEADVQKARSYIRSRDLYGSVSVGRLDGSKLPYINNLANLVVAEDLGTVPLEEVMRVLAPLGVACVKENGKWTRRQKSWPEQIDEWPQYLHGADNNCVAKDTVVGPPRHIQWISGPAWTRSHMGAATIAGMVSSRGRLFVIEDTTTAENPFLPAKWRLIARDAFNGVKLWTLDYPDWEQITVHIKQFHSQMKRRLAAIGDTVYCTPGLSAPLTALDAATGKTLRQYKGTEGTQEFVWHDGRLYVVIGDRMHFNAYGSETTSNQKGRKKKNAASQANPKRAFNGYGFLLSAYNPQTGNAENPSCVIASIDAQTGKEAWRTGKIDRYIGCTMALKNDKLVYQTAHGVFCLNARTGKENWAVKRDIPYGVGNMPNTLVLSSEAVYSEEGRSVFAYSLTDGSDYWGKSVKARKGYQASTDLLIAADALWMCGSCNNPKGVVIQKPTAYDLKTGDEVRTIDQILSKPMGHDRCFRNFITERFFINSKTGGPDCMDFKTGAEYPAPFTRATCSMGVLPCNGLLYLGPYACQCHLPVGLHNFNAYYTNESSLPTNGQVVEVRRSVRLEKGPAYGSVGKATDAPWPTFRQDARRYSGSSEQVPAAGLERQWKANLLTKASPPVIAERKLFVAESDAHTLHAMDADSGRSLWQYVAGGRIDSPPTYYKRLLLFGSRDGWVHCVRACDGVLSWRFRDLPEKLICAFDQLESAWPIHGSILLKNDTAYFCAGRSSYVDGGLFIYGLNPVTGAILHQRQFYGPYAEDGFPAFAEEGNRSETEVIKGTTADVMSSEGERLYIRHQAFNLDLTDGRAEKHLLSSAGMLEANRQHREYTLVQEQFNHRKTWTSAETEYPTGDILVSDGTDYYAVYGLPVTRGTSFFDPRRQGYALLAKTRSMEGWSNKWKANIQLTGKAMALAGDTVFVAGAPLVFKPDDLAATYEGRCGGVLWAASAADGSKLAQYTLDALPAWDGMASGYGRLFIVNQDGSIECWGQ